VTRTRLALAALVIAVAAVDVVGTSQAGTTTPDIATLVDRVEQERVRDHIASIDFRRLSLSKPDTYRRSAPR